MAGVKLFGTKDRDTSHAKLEEILKLGEYPRASCREDINDPLEPYTVWSDNPDPYIREPEPPAARPMTEDQMLDALAVKLLERLNKMAVK